MELNDLLFSECCKGNDRLEWFLLAPCSQYIYASALQLVFTLVFLVLLVPRLVSKVRPGPSEKPAERRAGALFIATLWIAGLVSLGYIGLEAWIAWTKIFNREQHIWTLALVFISFQTLKWIVFVTMVAHEKKFAAVVHPWPLRAWWILDSVVSCLAATSGIMRTVVSSKNTSDPLLELIDIFMLVTLPVSVFLLVLGVTGKTGILLLADLREPLLQQQSEAVVNSRYAEAGVFSWLTWSWLSPILSKGYKSALSIDDIPDLAPEDKAELTYACFEKEWTQVQHGELSMRNTLLKCFWKKLFSNGLLALIRLCVMYTGPILIQRFIDYSSAVEGARSLSEGCFLVSVLLVAKFVEVLSSHHYNFQSQRLGMLVRSTVITSVYQKGLRLSSSSKQGHGVGEIVNYMVVDAQQLQDLILQFHNMWVLPGQVCIALGLLYGVLGLPMLAGFAVMALVTCFNFHSTNQQRRYQTSLMKMRDARMKATNEVLNFMKVIKFQAWEEHFQKQVEAARNAEYGWLSKFMWALGRNIIMLWMCTSLVSMVTFAACVIFNVQLTPGKVFTATATFRILQEPIRAFPQTLISISQALVSFERLDKYMAAEELDPKAVEHVPASNSAISVERGCFTWDESTAKPTLQDISLDIKKGQLVTIVGTVGSGKSSLLTALLGEMRKLNGTVTVSGSTALVAQTAWIQNATIEENILFGLPMHKERYNAVINACALEHDLKIMEFGDQTEIGERGINLSGGQKQRIQLARAVYQDSDIYLLDDIFSAVDAHTGTQLFQECIKKALKGKTVLLVTHQVEFLHGADLVLVLREGAIVQSGKYADLLEEGTDLEALVAAHHNAMESINMHENEDTTGLDMVMAEEDSTEVKVSCSPHATSANKLPRLDSQVRSVSFQTKQKGTSKLIDDEKRESGRVGWKVYMLYCTKAFGWWAPVLIVLCQSGWTVVSVSSDYWLAAETSKSVFNETRFIIVYFIFSATSWILVGSRTVIAILAGLITAQAFYFDMLKSIFRTPLSFFDTTPSGRILSRFSTDQTQLDILLPFFFSGVVASFLATLGILFVTCQVTWPILILIVPLGCSFVWLQGYFLATSRELTRLTSITQAPVIFHFSETLAGILTIRAFKKQRKFVELNVSRVNSNIRMDFHNNAANEWLGSRLEMLGSLVLCVSALLFVTLPSNIVKPELVGLSLSYGLSLNSALFWCVWISCMVENKMVSVERIRQYTAIESEAPRINEAYRPPPGWPSNGTISMKDLQLRYRSNTPLVLKGLTLTIEGGNKVGIVGRTGSGKSTLIQAFFRLVEPCGGQIIVDGIDITQLGLADLRSRFGIIPQEPILFEGSIRSNVDPLGQYSDERIWEVLKRCQLKDVIDQKAEGLDSSVLDSGENWSVGQKQLFCLGRALLKESRILFLDEATASVDAQTDLIIQKTIKEQFANSTVISVAHRIPSVMDSDKVLVMAEGVVKEYDRPSVLLEQPASLFAALVREYATRSG